MFERQTRNTPASKRRSARTAVGYISSPRARGDRLDNPPATAAPLQASASKLAPAKRRRGPPTRPRPPPHNRDPALPAPARRQHRHGRLIRECASSASTFTPEATLPSRSLHAIAKKARAAIRGRDPRDLTPGSAEGGAATRRRRRAHTRSPAHRAAADPGPASRPGGARSGSPCRCPRATPRSGAARRDRSAPPSTPRRRGPAAAWPSARGRSSARTTARSHSSPRCRIMRQVALAPPWPSAPPTLVQLYCIYVGAPACRAQCDKAQHERQIGHVRCHSRCVEASTALGDHRANVLTMRLYFVVAILSFLCLARPRPADADITGHAGLNLRAANGAHPIRVMAGFD